MARSTLAPVAIPTTGYNVTDSAAFAALTAGANNGKIIDYDAAARIAGASAVSGLPSVNESNDYYSASLILLVRIACLTNGLRIG